MLEYEQTERNDSENALVVDQTAWFSGGFSSVKNVQRFIKIFIHNTFHKKANIDAYMQYSVYKIFLNFIRTEVNSVYYNNYMGKV